jgi:CRP-like cAMP-binding protein
VPPVGSRYFLPDPFDLGLARAVASNPFMQNPLAQKLERLYSPSREEMSLLDDLASNGVRTVEARQDIVRDGECPTDCNLILEGFACRYKLLPDGKRQIMSFQIAGDIVDIQAAIMDRMDHSVGALTRCRVASFSKSTVIEITEKHPRLARALWKDTLVDAAVFREWMASIGRRPAYQRIAHLMCEMAVRLDAVGLASGGSYPWPITQLEVGDSLGLSSVHVNRTLQELRGDGLITLRGSTLVIHDWEALQKAGDFTAEYLQLGSKPNGSLGAQAGRT